MLFSGSVRAYRCLQCNRHFCETIPTSLIPIILLIIVTASLWAFVLEQILGSRLLALLLCYPIAIVLMMLVYMALSWLLNPNLNKQICPRCGGQLKGVGGGFSDGHLPERTEWLTYAITLLLAGIAGAITTFTLDSNLS